MKKIKKVKLMFWCDSDVSDYFYFSPFKPKWEYKDGRFIFTFRLEEDKVKYLENYLTSKGLKLGLNYYTVNQ